MQAGVIMTQHMDRLPHREELSDQHAGLERSQWQDLHLKSKQKLSGLNKEKERLTNSEELKLPLNCWSEQESDSSCKLGNLRHWKE